jgi:hypothetical protein
MTKKIVLSTEVVERKKGGAEVIAVNLSDDAVEGLSTNGAEIHLPQEARERAARNSSTPPYASTPRARPAGA